MERPILPPRPVPVHLHVYGEIAFWVKKLEAHLIRDRQLSVFIRPDARDNPALKQWLPLFTPVPVFYLDAAAAKGGPLGFEPDDGTTVEVVRRTVCRLGEVLDQELHYNGGRAVPVTAADVKKYLEQELAPGKTFGVEHPITVSWVRYLPSPF